eukprot:754753-Hanusia_phi.AAC.8
MEKNRRRREGEDIQGRTRVSVRQAAILLPPSFTLLIPPPRSFPLLLAPPLLPCSLRGRRPQASPSGFGREARIVPSHTPRPAPVWLQLIPSWDWRGSNLPIPRPRPQLIAVLANMNMSSPSAGAGKDFDTLLGALPPAASLSCSKKLQLKSYHLVHRNP